jgi:hypothetical protein
MRVVEGRRPRRLPGLPEATSIAPRGVRGEAVRARLGSVGQGVIEALAYADVFDWPLTTAEIHRYLPVAATLEEVAAAMEPGAPASCLVERAGDLAMLRGRAELAGLRRQQTRHSAALWPRAVAWARIVGRLPFVRMVAVTGSLAVGAARDNDDVDLFVVTADGRLWLTRAMTMLVVRASRLRGLRLCPNYLLAASALRLSDRTLFTARELVQMVPVTGGAVYTELMARNAWYRGFLPNAEPRAPRSPSPRFGVLGRLLEAALGSRAADRLERWEMNRKTRQLCAESASTETRYDATCCKGHADEHGRRVLAAFEARLSQLAEVI